MSSPSSCIVQTVIFLKIIKIFINNQFFKLENGDLELY